MIAPLDESDRAVALLDRAASALLVRALDEASALVREAHALFAHVGGGDHADVASCLVLASRICLARHHLREARAHAERAEAIMRRWVVTGASDPDVARLALHAAIALAEVCLASSDYAVGIDRLVGAIGHAEAALDSSAAEELAAAWGLLGVLRKASGRLAAAEDAYGRAAALAGPEAEDLRLALDHNLAGLAHARGDFVTAEPLARRVLEARRRRFGASHPAIAVELAALAAILVGLARFDEAASLYHQALEIFSGAFGVEHPEVVLTLSALGALEATRARWQTAFEYCTRAFELGTLVLGADHVEIGRICQYLAVIARGKGEVANATFWSARALSTLEKRLAPDHPLLADARATAAHVP